MQCFPDMMTSFTDPVDKPGLGLPSGWWSVPIPHQWFDATPVLLRQPMRHFPKHNMIDVSERGRGEVRVFVERRPAPQLAVQAVHLGKIMLTITVASIVTIVLILAFSD